MFKRQFLQARPKRIIRIWCAFFIAVSLCCILNVPARAAEPSEATRLEFRDAYAEAQRGVTDAAYSIALQNYILFPYLKAARLRALLTAHEFDPAKASSTDALIESFIVEYGAEPVSRELRRAWLLSLAERGEWPLFMQHYRADAADAELRCHALSAQLAAPDAKELKSFVAVWMSPTRLPDACGPALAWTQAQNVITPELLEQRATLALKNGNAGFARELLKQLPSALAEPLSHWASLIERPQPTLDMLIANPDFQVSHDALLDGWTRLSRRDQDGALARYQRLVETRGLSAAQASPYALATALSLAWSRRPEALLYFERAQAADFNDVAWEWYARASIWAGDWQRVIRAVDAMPDSLKNTARWKYWRARALEQRGQTDSAIEIYAQLIDKEDNYYAVLAATRQRKPYAPHSQAALSNKDALAALGARPALLRARELLRVKLRQQATGEWNAAYDALQPGEKYAAIQLAASWGWYDMAIATATKQSVFNDYPLLYPRPYDREVKAASKLAKLPVELIYAQLRQESLYQADAQSSANALGLLQLLQSTARITAKRWKRPLPQRDDLLVPALNVPLGAAHLRDLMDKYQGQTVIALAAYNAGPNAVARWLPNDPMASDVWLENIPYNETRAYVQRILWHSVVFHWLQHDKAPDTRWWLGSVRR